MALSLNQLGLFEAKIIPRICKARNDYIETQPRTGRWADAKGWISFDLETPFVKPTKLFMSARDIGLLIAFFNLEAMTPEAAEELDHLDGGECRSFNLVFWGCDVIEASTFWPYFGA